MGLVIMLQIDPAIVVAAKHELDGEYPHSTVFFLVYS